jgi:multiple sugar transport system substrate-binding protein
MTPSGLYQAGRIKVANPEFYNSGDWMVIPFPKWKDAVQDASAPIGVNFYAVNSQSSRAKQIYSWRFIEALLAQYVDYLNGPNNTVPLLEAFDSAAYKALPYSEVFLHEMKRSKTQIVFNAPLIDARFDEALNAVMIRGDNPRDVMLRFRRDVEEISGLR